jgi:hypothetical protein
VQEEMRPEDTQLSDREQESWREDAEAMLEDKKSEMAHLAQLPSFCSAPVVGAVDVCEAVGEVDESEST